MAPLPNYNRFPRCLRVFKAWSVSMALAMALSAVLYAAEEKPVTTLPPIIAQASGPAFTIILWHDVDEDGIPDYKATYIFKDGRLQLLEKNPPTLEYHIPTQKKRS